jgi:hypothetical protein
MLVFSAIIVSLTLVALAAPDVKEYDLKFKGEGQFGYYPEGDLLVFFPAVGLDHVPDSLNVSHLGLSEVDWVIRVTYEDPYNPATYVFHSGEFSITGANGDNLTGYYDLWEADVDAGTYDLDWVFESGTGRFEGATGTGHTDGIVDFYTGEAEFEFSGTITVPKVKGKK